MKCCQCELNHRLHLYHRVAGLPDATEIIVVRGPRPYLWLGRDKMVLTVNGNATLRKVALAILDELRRGRR